MDSIERRHAAIEHAFRLCEEAAGYELQGYHKPLVWDDLLNATCMFDFYLQSGSWPTLVQETQDPETTGEGGEKEDGGEAAKELSLDDLFKMACAIFGVNLQ